MAEGFGEDATDVRYAVSLAERLIATGGCFSEAVPKIS